MKDLIIQKLKSRITQKQDERAEAFINNYLNPLPQDSLVTAGITLEAPSPDELNQLNDLLRQVQEGTIEI